MEFEALEASLQREIKIREEATLAGMCGTYEQYPVIVAEIKILRDVLEMTRDIKSGIDRSEE